MRVRAATPLDDDLFVLRAWVVLNETHATMAWRVAGDATNENHEKQARAWRWKQLNK